MTVTGGFAGEVSGIREYFDPDDFDDVITVNYLSATSGGTVETQVFCSEQTDVDGPTVYHGSVRATYLEVIVGRDHVKEPGGGDLMTVVDPNGTEFAVDDQIRIIDVLRSDGDTAMMRGEKV